MNLHRTEFTQKMTNSHIPCHRFCKLSLLLLILIIITIIIIVTIIIVIIILLVIIIIIITPPLTVFPNSNPLNGNCDSRVSNATVSVANVENAHHSTRWDLVIGDHHFLGGFNHNVVDLIIITIARKHFRHPKFLGF